MTIHILKKEQLAQSSLGAIAQLKEHNWIEPESPQKTYLKDFRRHNLEISFETSTSRGELEDKQLDIIFNGALAQDGLTEEEIELIKRFYSQNLLSINVASMMEALMRMGLTPARQSDGEQNRRILIKKVMIDGVPKVIAEATYWDIHVYKETSSGVFDTEAGTIQIPGRLTSTYILTPQGFDLSQVKASNSYISQLIKGEHLDINVEELALCAAEEEYETSIETLTAAEQLPTNDKPLKQTIHAVKKEMAYSKSILSRADKNYTANVNKLSTAADVLSDAIQAPYHLPTITRLEKAADNFQDRKSKKLKWALIGAASLIVVGLCVTAAVMSYGALSTPSYIVAKAATSTAIKAGSIVLGSGALVSSGASFNNWHYENKCSIKNNLRQAKQQLPFFNRAQTRNTSSPNSSAHADMTNRSDLMTPLLS